MKQFVKSVFKRTGLSVHRNVELSEIQSLLAKLHPVLTDKPLVRLGGDSDGGYLLPDDLDGIEACYSPGVDVTASFERALVERGIPCFLADASVEKAPIDGPLIDFEPKFLGTTDDAKFFTLDSWVKAKTPAHGDSMLLQMDIEGAEWAVLLNVSEELLRSFRIIVLELHVLHRLVDEFALMIMRAGLERLLKDFYVVHNHPNNCSPLEGEGDVMFPRVLELTLIRKDRVTVTGYAKTFPHPLDVDNMPEHPRVVLPANMYRAG
jgi:hypothetical protein